MTLTQLIITACTAAIFHYLAVNCDAYGDLHRQLLMHEGYVKPWTPIGRKINAPIVFILIGNDDDHSRMNLFISSALYSRDFYHANGVPINNIIVINDQHYPHSALQMYGDKVVRSDDKYRGSTWPPNTYFSHPGHYKTQSGTAQDNPAAAGITKMIQKIIAQRVTPASGDITPLVFEFHGHGSQNPASIRFSRFGLKQPEQWVQFLSQAIFVPRMIGNDQLNPVLFINKQCFGAPFAQEMRNAVERVNRVNAQWGWYTIDLVTVTADSVACPSVISGSQATSFLHTWMRHVIKQQHLTSDQVETIPVQMLLTGAQQFAVDAANGQVDDLSVSKMKRNRRSSTTDYYPLESFAVGGRINNAPLSMFGVLPTSTAKYDAFLYALSFQLH